MKRGKLYKIKIDKGFGSKEGSLKTDKDILIKFYPDPGFIYTGNKELKIFKDKKRVILCFSKSLLYSLYKYSDFIKIYNIFNGKKIEVNDFELIRKGYSDYCICVKFNNLNKGKYLIKLLKGMPSDSGEKLQKDYKLKVSVFRALPEVKLIDFKDGVIRLDIKGITRIKFILKKIGNSIEKKYVNFSMKNINKFARKRIDLKELFDFDKTLYAIGILDFEYPSQKMDFKLDEEKSLNYWAFLLNNSSIHSTILFLKGGNYFLPYSIKEYNQIHNMEISGFDAFNKIFNVKITNVGKNFIKSNDLKLKGPFSYRLDLLLNSNGVYSFCRGYNAKISAQLYSEKYKLVSMLFTDRKYYLPEEDVNIAGIIKKVYRNRFTNIKNAFIIIKGPGGETIKKERINIDEFGGFHYLFKTHKTTKRGDYLIKLKHNNWESEGRFIKIGFFKPNIFEIKQSIEKKIVRTNQKNMVSIRGMYYNGTPMVNDKLKIKLYIDSNSYLFKSGLKKEFRKYSFSSGYFRKTVKLKDKKLDFEGKLKFHINSFKLKIPFLSKITVEATGISKDKKEFSTKKSFYYIPSEAIVGMKIPCFVKRGKRFPVDFIVLNSKGEETETYANIEISRDYESNRLKKEKVKEEKVLIRGKLRKYFRFDKTGHYTVKVVSKDKKGYVSVIKSDFYVWDYDYELNFGNDYNENADRIKIRFSKEKFSVGEMAKAYISSPESGKGLVVLFTEEVEESRIINFNKTNEIEFKIKKNYFPSIGFLVIIRYVDKSGKKRVLSSYKTIKVEDISKGINIKAYMKKELKPSKEYEIKIKTTDYKKRGVKTKIFAYAVDEGVLSLSNYKTPEPLLKIYYPFYYGYVLYDTFQRHDIVKPNPFLYPVFFSELGKLERMIMEGIEGGVAGGVYGGVLGGFLSNKSTGIFDLIKKMKTRKNLCFTQFFKSIETDDKGDAVLRFKTSDLLSKFRLILIAYTNDSYGSLEKRFTVSKELMIKDSYPDFLRKGDEVKAGILVINKTSKKIKAKVFIKTDNKISVKGDSVRIIYLKPKNTKTVFFKTIAKKKGLSKIKFYCVSNGLTDGMEKDVEVKENIIKQSILDFDSGNKINKRYLLSSEKRDYLQISISSSLLNSSLSIAKKLMIYPYECFEQRTSKLMPYLVLGDKLLKYGALDFDKKRVDNEIKYYLKILPHYMSRDGGLCYYGHSNSSEYLSVYVLYALKLIKEKGYEINGNIIKKIFSFLEKRKLFTETRAFYVYVKALWGKNIKEEITELNKNYENLSLLSKAFYLKAVGISDIENKNAMILKIVRDLENRMVVEADFAYFKSSSLHDDFEFPFYSAKYLTAIILGAILDSKDDYVFAHRVINYLMEKENSVWWWFTTHSNVWILDTLSKYIEKVEKTQIKHVKLELSEANNILFKKNIGFVKLSQFFKKNIKYSEKKERNILLKASSSSVFYLTSELNRNVDIKKENNSGIGIKRIIYDKNGNIVKQFKRGRIYQVVLKIKTREPMNYVVVDEPIVGGVQVLREDVYTTRRLRDFRRKKDRRNIGWWGIISKGFKKDRIIFYTYGIRKGIEISYYIKALYSGRFRLLPTSAFSMYHPQLNGRTKMLLLRIK